MAAKKGEHVLPCSSEDLIFALDIGTRSVIGIAGYKSGEVFKVLESEKEEYTSRVVVDGQIDDIAQTALTALKVKERIEAKLNINLTSVHIAAAGRSLETVMSEVSLPIENGTVTRSFNKKLESYAVEKAIEQVNSKSDRSYYYVGHTVQKYMLDDYEIASILDHKGQNVSVHMIVTFLPREVVESLYSTMKKIGLTVAGLTLEPIAAMNVVIPKELRKLNLALCDIGAGTSDIAACKNGVVTGYTMATIAGDEVTDVIMQACLCDFNEAEKIKKQMTENDLIEYENILGLKEQISKEQIQDVTEETIRKLSQTIAQKVFDINDKSPAALFLVGGGSRVRNLKEYVAHDLGMDIKFVSSDSNVYMKKVIDCEKDLYTPEYATPLGIAITAIDENSTDTFTIKVNNESIHLFNIWDTSVLGVLQMSGYKYEQIMGKRGKGISFTFNGQPKNIRGGIATPAEIKINGKVASLSDKINTGDEIEFTPCTQGDDAGDSLRSLVKSYRNINITLNGTPYNIGHIFTVNGKEMDADYVICEGDDIVLQYLLNLGQVLEAIEFGSKKIEYYVNSSSEELDYEFAPNDELQVFSLSNKTVAVNEFRGSTVNLYTQEDKEKIISDDKKIRVDLNGETLVLLPKQGGDSYCVFDLLYLADIDTKNPEGDLVMRLNDVEIESFVQNVKSGDRAEIYWQK